LDRNGLSVSTETACRFEPKSPAGNSEICILIFGAYDRRLVARRLAEEHRLDLLTLLRNTQEEERLRVASLGWWKFEGGVIS